MKPFDLDAALAGEPVRLDCGGKAYVAYRIPEERLNGVGYPLRGYIVDFNDNIQEDESWRLNGKCSNFAKHGKDIIGMWEEPREQVTITFPAPLKEPQEGMYLVNDSGNIQKSCYTKSNHAYDDAKLEAGFYFATKEDAEAFLAAMKDARR